MKESKVFCAHCRQLLFSFVVILADSGVSQKNVAISLRKLSHSILSYSGPAQDYL